MPEGSPLVFSRIHTDIVNRAKVTAIFDFPLGEYLANRSFFDELSKIQTDLINDRKVKLQTGQEVDLESNGGLLALQFYMETVETARNTMVGLAKLGLGVEKQVWKFQ